MCTNQKLTAKQQRFVDEYLIDLNATQAAIRAGYSEKTARQTGQENLTKPVIKEAVKIAMLARQERTGISQDYVIEVIVDTIERCRQSRPVYDRKGDMVMVETASGALAPAYAFDSVAVFKGTKQLGEHLGMFVTRHEHTGKDGKPIEVDVVSSVIHRIWDENEENKGEE